ncbi:MAG: hypothetical protein ACLSE4_02235 [Clostridium sp.]
MEAARKEKNCADILLAKFDMLQDRRKVIRESRWSGIQALEGRPGESGPEHGAAMETGDSETDGAVRRAWYKICAAAMRN